MATADLMIELGKIDNQPIQYNFTKFLSDYNERSEEQRLKTRAFTRQLDAKVLIKHVTYEHIYTELDIIINRIVTKLKESPKYKSAEIIPTGSKYADTKVGLPLEADYVIRLVQEENDKGDDMDIPDLPISHFQQRMMNIVAKRKTSLLMGLTNWTTGDHDTYSLPNGGICLVLKYADATGPIGFTVDLLPVVTVSAGHHLASYWGTRQEAKTNLGYGIDRAMEQGQLVHLVTVAEIDTGIIENQLVKDLSEEKKVAFRVAKYLPQHFLAYRTNLCDEEKARIYGYKSLVKSYALRICFLHLLFQTHGKPEAKQLTEDVLVHCLLDMLAFCYWSAKGKIGAVRLNHPLITNERKQFVLCGDSELNDPIMTILREIRQNYALEYPFDNLDYYKLMNSPNPRLDGLVVEEEQEEWEIDMWRRHHEQSRENDPHS